jgi:hypothetical protein
LVLVAVAVLLVVLAVTRTRAPAPTPVAEEPLREVPAKKKKPRAPKPAATRTKPAAKPCLATPEVEGEAGIAASTGLAYADARAALNAFAPELVSCLGPDESPTGTLLLSITVACTGLVDKAVVADRGDWSADAAACVTDRLAYAEFPAHGLPDGDVVEWPLRYTPP